MKKYFRNQKGSVALLALWTVVGLTFMVLTLAYGVRQKITTFHHLDKMDEARLKGEALLKKAIAETIDSGGKSEGGDYRITSENGKININKATADTLRLLLQKIAGVEEQNADELAYAIVDFRDADDFISMHFDKGSEKDSYSRAGLQHAPKNAGFEFIYELLWVKGMTKDIYSLIRNYITIYGDGRVNINTCDSALLAVLDFSPDLADKIDRVRRGQDLKIGTRDDFIFLDVQNMGNELARFAPISESENGEIRHAIVQRQIGTVSDCFSIAAIARFEGLRREMVCVYHLRDGIKYWAEG